MMGFISSVSALLLAGAVVWIGWHFRDRFFRQKRVEDDDDFWMTGV